MEISIIRSVASNIHFCHAQLTAHTLPKVSTPVSTTANDDATVHSTVSTSAVFDKDMDDSDDIMDWIWRVGFGFGFGSTARTKADGTVTEAEQRRITGIACRL